MSAAFPTIRTLDATGTALEPGTALTATQTGLKNLKVVLAPNGEGAAVWELPLSDRTVVRGSTRSAAGAWSTPVDISANTAGVNAISPDVGIDATGRATVVWDSRFRLCPASPAGQASSTPP